METARNTSTKRTYYIYIALLFVYDTRTIKGNGIFLPLLGALYFLLFVLMIICSAAKYALKNWLFVRGAAARFYLFPLRVFCFSFMLLLFSFFVFVLSSLFFVFMFGIYLFFSSLFVSFFGISIFVVCVLLFPFAFPLPCFLVSFFPFPFVCWFSFFALIWLHSCFLYI